MYYPECCEPQATANPRKSRGRGAILQRACGLALRSFAVPMKTGDLIDAERTRKPGADWNEIRGQLETLDMILFRGWDWVSRGMLRIESQALGSETARYSHCALVLQGSDFPIGSPFRDDRKLYTFECTDQNEDKVRNVSGENFTGVQLRDLDAVVENYDLSTNTELAWMRMRDEVRPNVDPESLQRIVEQYIDRRFQWNPIYMFGALYETFRPLRDRYRRRWKSERLLCSELSALVLRDFGVLPQDVDPLDVIPTDFRPLNQTETMDRDGEVPVLFDDAVIFTAYPRWST